MEPMQPLTPDNVLAYLESKNFDVAGATAEFLEWGVSNSVLRVNRPGHDDLVVKQSCERLRTTIDWRSRLDRNAREAAVQQYLSRLELALHIPRVLAVDPDEHAYVMEAVTAKHRVWKAELLAERIEPGVFETVAGCLARIHRDSAVAPPDQQNWSDREVFDELRIDPFYRWVAQHNSTARAGLIPLIKQLEQTGVSVVLADFSPKNILLAEDKIVAVDFETAHWGDPAFDVGFFLSHLVLKSIHGRHRRDDMLRQIDGTWATYHAEIGAVPPSWHLPGLPFPERCLRHLGACMLARVEGKSPVDYLSEPQRQTARSISLPLLLGHLTDWDEVPGFIDNEARRDTGEPGPLFDGDAT